MVGKRWERRSDARPDEIVDAALIVFAERGFAAAKLEDVAKRAGVAKSLIYAYFETKEDLFRAVVRDRLAPNLDAVREAAESFEGPFVDLVPEVLLSVANAMEATLMPAIARVVIGESRSFPDLARIWHDAMLIKAVDSLTDIVKRAQERGEVNSGDPGLYVFSILGPMVMAILQRSVFQDVMGQPPDIKALAVQHADTILPGILTKPIRRQS